MSIIENLLASHPIRKTEVQKEAFRTWAIEKSNKLGYSAKTDKIKMHNNVIVGNPETAEVVFTAHYDTPSTMFFPNICIPKNPVLFWVYQFAVVFMIPVPCAIAAYFIGKWIGYDDLWRRVLSFTLIAQALLILFGRANKNNANDNSSGVAALFEIMERLPEERRDKAAFILFDNEEKGLKGSKAFAKAHAEIKQNKMIINLDCVGDGENIMLSANKQTREMPAFSVLDDAMKQQSGRIYHMNKLEKCIYNSDQKNFKCGIAVCACRKSKFCYYFDKIHTNKDVVCDQKNLDFIADGLAAFVENL